MGAKKKSKKSRKKARSKRGVDLAELEVGADLSSADLAGQHFEDVTLTAVVLTKADLSGSTWKNCVFDNAGVKGLQLDGADLSGASFEDCHFEIVQGERVKAEGVRFVRCRFGFANFEKSKMRDAVFEDVSVANGLHMLETDCRGASISLVADATHAPGTVNLTKADLRGASLVATLSSDEEARIRRFELTRSRWSEFTIQLAKTDDATTITYGRLPFDAPKPPTPRVKLRGRAAVHDCEGWGTVQDIDVRGDIVIASEGSWQGDASHYGAPCGYRVRAWKNWTQIWERKLHAGSSSTGDVKMVAAKDKVFCLTEHAAFVLELATGNILEEEEFDEYSHRFWGGPGAIVEVSSSESQIRKIGKRRAKNVPGSIRRSAGSFVFRKADFDQDEREWTWALHDTKTSEDAFMRVGRPTASVFSGDGSRLAVAWNDEIEIFSTKNGRSLRAFDPAPDRKRKPKVTQLAFSADGKRLAGECGTVCLWKTKTGELIHRFGKHEPPVRALRFTEDGQIYIGAGLPKEQRLISLHPIPRAS